MRDFDVSQISGRLLRVFIAVYDEMSVSKAAEQLDSSQSTVSHNLEKLRSILGDTLFVQSGRGILPSARAEALAPKIRRLLAEMEALADAGDYRPELDQEPVVIASNGSSMAGAVALICNRIWSEIPGKRLSFRELSSRDSVEKFLNSGGADIALTARRAPYPATLLHEPLFTDVPYVYYDASQRGPVASLDDYCSARHAQMEFGGGPVKTALQQALDERGLVRDVAITVPNVWLLAMAVKGTGLITTLPSRLAAPACDGLASCPLPLPLQPVNFDLVWHRRHNESAKLQWLRSRILSALTASGAG